MKDYDTFEFPLEGLEQYGKLIDFDDGHVPETFSSGSHHVGKKILIYTQEDLNHTEPTIQIYQNVIPNSICLELYNFSKESNQPWGTYVTKEDILGESKTGCLDIINRLALETSRYFLNREHSTAHIIHGDNDRPLRPLDDDRVHGVQIWALASDVGSSVPVHIDYAEYLRYCYNITVPPLYAGTLHCTPADIQGGSFAVNVRGLEYYREVGYKGIFVSDRMGKWNPDNSIQYGHSKGNSDGWYTIPYKYNQGILHTGNLAHLSSPVDQIEGMGSKRVIIGFNVFAKDVGAYVQKVPEHSAQFRRLVRMTRTIATRNGGLCLEEIKANKPLMKMLVSAKRKQKEMKKRQQDKCIYEWLARSYQAAINFTTSDIISKWEAEVASDVDLIMDMRMIITLLVRSKKCLCLEQKQYLLLPVCETSCFDENGLLNLNSDLSLVEV